MADGGQVLTMLCPDVEWTITENDYDSIDWYGKKPAITKKQFEEALANYDALKAAEEAEKLAKRQEILDRLGLSEEEAQLLLKR